jgi:hypothetical protein
LLEGSITNLLNAAAILAAFEQSIGNYRRSPADASFLRGATSYLSR